MPTKLWSVGNMLDRCIRKIEASAGVQTDREEVLEDMQEVYQDFWLFGDVVGDVGWIWMLATTTVTVGAATPLVALTGLGGGIPVVLRREDGGELPISLAQWGQAQFHATTWDRAVDGNPSTWCYASYDPATDVWTIRVWPVPDVSEVLTVLYQREGSELVDSYANADSVFVPAHLRPGLVKGTVAQGFLGSDRFNRYQIAAAEYEEWKMKARIHVERRTPPSPIIVGSEMRVRTGRGYPEYWAWT